LGNDGKVALGKIAVVFPSYFLKGDDNPTIQLVNNNGESTITAPIVKMYAILAIMKALLIV